MERFFWREKKGKTILFFPVPKTPVVLFHGVMDPFILSGGHAAGLFLFCFVPVSQLTPIEGIFFLMEAPVDRGHSLIYIDSGSLDAWNNAVLRDSGSE